MALRIEIDGRWNAAEFAAFYRCLNEIYRFYLFDRDSYWWEHGPYGHYFEYRRFDATDLAVQRIDFASPGFTDVAGIASAVREVREFIQFVITYIGASKDRQLTRDLQAVEIQEKKLDLLRKLAEMPAFPIERAQDYAALLGVRAAQLPNIDPIVLGIAEGRIVGCSTIQTEKQGEQ